MFDAILRNLSLRRSAAGIYYELRTLRQMLEVVFEHEGLELPAARRARDRGDLTDEIRVEGPDEERLAERAAEQIAKDRLSGRDPGTTWRPDPER